MREVSVAVSERLDHCTKEMNLVNSPLVDQSPLSYEYLMHKTSCETNTFVSNIPPKTPINNNPLRNKRFRNTFEPLINKANHVDSEPHVEPQIEIIKLDDFCDGSKPVSSRQTTSKHITKPPKNEVACSFLRRRGFCLKERIATSYTP